MILFLSPAKKRALLETLHHIAEYLPLKEAVFQKFPIPTAAGDYFGFQLIVEGGVKKEKRNKEEGFRFLTTIELPKRFKGRIFLQNERRKTSLKPIAGLKLVHTSVKKFDEQFLLLADDEELAGSVFQPYLCEKIISIPETHWQLDVHRKEAHFEVWQAFLNAKNIAELLRLVVETLNAALVRSS
ncbi:MAG: hypothetical protein HY877_05270 [Deltaproteobacteria bacterium]|nr:hypothetical protein [Deltaproteobacteria bacterium]